jgi:hypothetical protein
MNPNTQAVMLAKHDEAQKQRTVNKVIQKAKAANASLNGAPHGAQSAPPARREKGLFGDVAADVRAAMSHHS